MVRGGGGSVCRKREGEERKMGRVRGREKEEKKEYFRGRPFVPHVSKLMAGASTETLEEKTII